MIYLDYSATTPIDEEVLETFVKSAKYIGNPNSLHKLGFEAKELIDASTKQIKKILNLNDVDVIYTSGSSESNNLAIKGIEKYQNRGNEIITTDLEHSSIYEPINYMVSKGFKVKYVKLNKGLVDLNDLENKITDKTILVTIGAVNSETGIRQNIEEIGKILKKYPKVIFHVDATQAIGKIKLDFKDVDMFSFSAHKFFGIKGIGALIKKKNIDLTPLISGGKSTTIYRSGTPCTQLIASLAKALRLSYENMDNDLIRIKKLNKMLTGGIKDINGVSINSNEYSIPHIVNISVSGVKPETMLHALEEDNIYISTKSACSKGGESRSVYAITNSNEKANTSLRVSISRKTTEEEIKIFINSFKKKYQMYKF